MPVDGLILEGSTSIDGSMITGESPVEKLPGAGHRWHHQRIGWRGDASRSGGRRPLLSHIVQMVAGSAQSCAYQRTADVVAGYFLFQLLSAWRSSPAFCGRGWDLNLVLAMPC